MNIPEEHPPEKPVENPAAGEGSSAPPPPGEADGKTSGPSWFKGALKVVFAAAVAGALTHWEGRRVDSQLPVFDDLVLEQVQKFLPPGKSGPLVLESRPDIDTRVYAPARDDSPLPVELWEFAREDEHTLLAWPPGPVDIAMLLPRLASRNPGGICLAQVPSWPTPPEGTLATRAFAGARRDLSSTVFTAAIEPAYSSAPADDAADRLAALTALDPACVRGDHRLLPEVNDPGPPISPGNGIAANELGFARLLLLEPLPAPPGRVALPMLARSGDRILPSLPLLTIARTKGINPEQWEVHLGTAILLGDQAIPIDARGCLLLPAHFAQRVRKFSPLDLEAPAPAEAGLPAVIGHEGLPILGGESGAGGANTGVWTAAVMGAVRAGDYGLPVRVLRRAPETSSIILAIALAAAAIVSLRMGRGHRLWIAGAMLATLFFASRHAAGSLGLFHGASFVLAVWLAAFATALRHQEKPG